MNPSPQTDTLENMAEPTTSTAATGLVALAIAFLGPAAGEYAVIVLAALAGALWALQRMPTHTRADGALLVFRLVLTAVVLTGGAAWWLETQHQLPSQQVLAPIAFLIGGWGERLPALVDMLIDRLTKRGAP